jgi:hypothetical protein
VPAACSVAAVAEAVSGFLTLEARLALAGAEPAVTPSWRLPELMYRVVGVARCAAGGPARSQTCAVVRLAVPSARACALAAAHPNLPPAAPPRHQRRQLVRLCGLDGAAVWCDARELAANSRCLLLHHAPCSAPGGARLLRRGDAGAVPLEHVVRLTCREPVRLLCSLEMAPQHALEPAGCGGERAPQRVVVLCGPRGAGRSALGLRLLRDFPDKFAAAPRVTSRAPHPLELLASAAMDTVAAPAPAAAGGGEATQLAEAGGGGASMAGAPLEPGALPAIGAGAPGGAFLRFVAPGELALLQAGGGLAECCERLGASSGTPLWGLQAAWAAGKVALVVGPLAASEALKRLRGAEVRSWQFPQGGQRCK